MGSPYDLYVDLMRHVEELASRYVETMEIDGLTGQQALVVLRLGAEEVPVGGLSTVYFGTNVSYNIARLEERGFITRTRSAVDKRLTIVALTEKGHEVRARLLKRHEPFMSRFGEVRSEAALSAIKGLRSVTNGDGYPPKTFR